MKDQLEESSASIIKSKKEITDLLTIKKQMVTSIHTLEKEHLLYSTDMKKLRQKLHEFDSKSTVNIQAQTLNNVPKILLETPTSAVPHA